MSVTLPVVAVVPTFSPPESTTELLMALGAECTHVVVSDDASACTSDRLLRSWESLPNIELIRHDRNRGIARGLNDGLRIARELGSNWLVTVDQDTTLPAGYVGSLVASADQRVAAGEPLGALGAGTVADATGELRYPLRDSEHGTVTEEIIQTGSAWNVPMLTALGGFDESLGIDAVDAAACLALRQRGMSIGVLPGARIDHAIGAGRTLHIAGRSIMVTGHSPARRASMMRNRLRLFPAEFGQSPRHAVRTLRRVLVNQSLGLVVEGGRWGKLKGSIRGLSGKSADSLQP